MKKKYSKSNKITGLETMRDLGFNVPRFDFIPDYTELSLKDIDINTNYPPGILEKITKEKLKKFNLKNGISVRSASFDEDNTNQSSAGRYISFNGLSSIKEILEAEIAIWQHHRYNSKDTICPLIIQETHPSYYSGVAFKDGEKIIIESYYGVCANIVNGAVKPYMTSVENGEIVHNYSSQNNYNAIYSVHENIFRNKVNEPGRTLMPKIDTYPMNNRLYLKENKKILRLYANRPSLPIKYYENKIIPQIIEILNKLDNENGVDIEWGSDINGNVYMYQFRKLTRNIKNLKINVPNSVYTDGIIYGIPTSGGKAEGISTYDEKSVDENSILIIEHNNINNLEILKKVKGIISYNGGILTHLSIICRELNIPCIVGVNDIPDNAKISMDGEEGIIKILKKDTP